MMQYLIGSALRSAVALGGAYLLGAFGFSYAWILLGLTAWVARDYHMHERLGRLEFGRLFQDNEKALVTSRLGELPAWVFFPDTERAEWLNRILKQMWPFFGEFMTDLIKGTVEPAIRSSFPSYLQSFRFERICLGDIPPRIGGVKVYSENVARDEIILDCEFLYCGDCEFLIGVKGFQAGIKDLQMHGTMRIIAKPLVKQMPLVGALTVFFLTPPAVDFNLTKLADVLDIPGLSDMLRQAVVENLRTWIVLPNQFPIQLMEGVPMKLLKFRIPAGVLRIHVIGAKELMKSDVGLLGLGKSDPYGIITVGCQEFRTPVINNTIQPKWNFYCEAVVDQLQGQTIDIDLMDQDQSTKDDFLGRVTVPIFPLALRGHADMWLQLEQVETGKVHLGAQWLTLSDDAKDLTAALENAKNISTKSQLSSALLLVYVDSATNLPNAAKSLGEPSPLVSLAIGDHKKQTNYCRYTNHPVWEETFYFLLSQPQDLALSVKVTDFKSGKPLGHVSVPMSRFFKEHVMHIEEPFMLSASGSLSKIIMTMRMKVLVAKKATVDFTPELSEEEKLLEEQISQENVAPQRNGNSMKDSSDGKKAIPSLEEMVQSTVAPIAETAEVLANPTETPSSESCATPTKVAAGKVQLTLRYSLQRNRLIAVVHKAVDLPKVDSNVPDPYVKLYLLPDRSREGKQKTSTCKSTCCPVFDETFEFDVMMSDVSSHSLEVTVNSKSGSSVFSRGQCLGKAVIVLSQMDLSKTVTAWYPLDVKDD